MQVPISPPAPANQQSAADKNAPPAHIARLLKVIDRARTGSISIGEFAQNVDWGKQLLHTAIQSSARLPQSSPDNTVNNALHSLRNGLQNFRDAIKALEAYQRDFYPGHLDDASALLLQACQIFVALQQITQKRH